MASSTLLRIAAGLVLVHLIGYTFQQFGWHAQLPLVQSAAGDSHLASMFPQRSGLLVPFVHTLTAVVLFYCSVFIGERKRAMTRLLIPIIAIYLYYAFLQLQCGSSFSALLHALAGVLIIVGISLAKND